MGDEFNLIVGAGRSGTSLLRTMVSSHSEWHVPPESHFIARMSLVPWRYSGSAGHSLFVSDVLANGRLALWGIDEDWLRRYVPDRGSENSVGQLLHDLFGAVAVEQGARRYADKTPNNVLALQRIRLSVGPIKVLNIVRDPLAVVASLLRTEGWGFDDPLAAAVYWRRCVAAAKRASRFGIPVLTVRYEDLVADPATLLRSVCQFLDSEFEPSMLEFQELGAKQETEHRFGSNHQRLSGVLAIEERWKTELSPQDVAEVKMIVGSDYERLGYGRPIRPSAEVVGRAVSASTAEAVGPARLRMVSGIRRLVSSND